jgi:hypothetical protein
MLADRDRLRAMRAQNGQHPLGIERQERIIAELEAAGRGNWETAEILRTLLVTRCKECTRCTSATTAELCNCSLRPKGPAAAHNQPKTETRQLALPR